MKNNTSPKIARTWHGVVPEEKSEEYYQYLLRTGIEDYRSTKGNCGVHIFRRNEEKRTHFLLLTLWDSYDSIQAFAGDDIERARYYPRDKEFLLELEPFVKHYEVVGVGGQSVSLPVQPQND